MISLQQAPSCTAGEAGILPLNYSRSSFFLTLTRKTKTYYVVFLSIMSMVSVRFSLVIFKNRHQNGHHASLGMWILNAGLLAPVCHGATIAYPGRRGARKKRV